MFRASDLRACLAVTPPRLAIIIQASYASGEALLEDGAQYHAIDGLYQLRPRELSLAEIIVTLSFLKTATKGSMRQLLARANYYGLKLDEGEAAKSIYGDEKETYEVCSCLFDDYEKFLVC